MYIWPSAPSPCSVPPCTLSRRIPPRSNQGRATSGTSACTCGTTTATCARTARALAVAADVACCMLPALLQLLLRGCWACCCSMPCCNMLLQRGCLYTASASAVVDASVELCACTAWLPSVNVHASSLTKRLQVAKTATSYDFTQPRAKRQLRTTSYNFGADMEAHRRGILCHLVFFVHGGSPPNVVCYLSYMHRMFLLTFVYGGSPPNVFVTISYCCFAQSGSCTP